MKKATNQAASAGRPAATTEIAALLGNDKENLDAVAEANQALTSGMAAWGQEVMGFASKRLGENLKRSESLVQCKDVKQAFDLNVGFAQRATEQYLDEANKLLGLATQISRNCWAPLQARTKETLLSLNGDDEARRAKG